MLKIDVIVLEWEKPGGKKLCSNYVGTNLVPFLNNHARSYAHGE